MNQIILPIQAYFKKNSRLKNILYISVLMYIIFIIYFEVILKYDFFITDVLIYWKDSFNWRTPFSKWWVPGYSLLITLTRFLTFGFLSPVTTMWLVAGFFYLLSIAAVYKILANNKTNNAYYMTLVFAAFPFIGITESVNPRADTTAIALTALCILSFENRKWLAFTAFAAAAMMVHKATWFIIPPFMAFTFIKYKSSRLWLPLALLPLLSWIVCGAIYYKNIFWFMHYAVQNLMSSRPSMPVFDGVYGVMYSAETAKMIKGGIVILILALAIACGYYSFRLKYWPGLFVCLSILLMSAVLNGYEIWAVVRFSRLIVIPFAYVLSRLKPRFVYDEKYVFLLMLLVGILSNFMFGYYMTTA